MMALLWFVRHAPAAVSGVCYGQSDVATQMPAGEAADLVERCLPSSAHFEAVWCSPLLRCRDPASMLAARFGVPHRVDRRLLELSFGDWEGCSYASLENDPAFRNWTDNWQRVAPPKGESLDELVARVRDWLAEVREGNGAHLVVAHAGVMRAAQMLLGNATAAEAWKTTVPHLSPVLWRTGES